MFRMQVDSYINSFKLTHPNSFVGVYEQNNHT